MTQQGTCRFCGQQHFVVVGEELPEQEINELATLECKCDKSREYQCRTDSLTHAKAWIEAHPWDDKTKALMNAAAGAVIDKVVDRVTVKKEDFNYTLKLNAEGYLVFSQKQSISAEERF